MGVIQTRNGWGHQDLHNTILIAMNSDLDPVYFLEGRTLRKEVCFLLLVRAYANDLLCYYGSSALPDLGLFLLFLLFFDELEDFPDFEDLADLDEGDSRASVCAAVIWASCTSAYGMVGRLSLRGCGCG